MTACPTCIAIPKTLSFFQPNAKCTQKGPELGDTVAPWVRVKLNGTGDCITVGNESAPTQGNCAVIKSFEFGHTDGTSVTIVIHDQHGGMLERFLKHITHHVQCLKNPIPPNNTMTFEWGWCKSGCDVPYPDSRSPCHLLLVTGVETTYTEGVYIAEISGKDVGHVMLESNSDKLEGSTEEKGVCLTHAIRKTFRNAPAPCIKKIDFSRLEAGLEWPCGFEYFDWDCRCFINKRGMFVQSEDQIPPIVMYCNLDGPRGGWSVEGQDKLQAVKRWLSSWRTDKRKQWTMQYDSVNTRMVFWEDRKPLCAAKADSYWESNCIGEYIVNGGNDSPVIEFNPRINWHYGLMSSGGGLIAPNKAGPLQPPDAGPGQQYGGAKTPGRVECPPLNRKNNPGAGHTNQIIIDRSVLAFHGGDAGKRAQEAQEAQNKAMPLLQEPIRADLVIIGDPTLISPAKSMGAVNVSLIVVNPKFLTHDPKYKNEKDKTDNLDWSERPALHPTFTNKAWKIESMTHRIEAGRYTTTLKLYLTSPGVDGDPNAPWGLSGTWKPLPCS